MILYSDLNGYDQLLICNGCKPEWFPDWVNADLIFGCACGQHDVDYFAGGLESDRKEADEKFYKKMQLLIKESKLGWFKKWLLRRAAKAYYKLVKKFGDSTFSYRHRKTSDGSLVSYKLTSSFSLPSYCQQADYRFYKNGKFEDKKLERHNNRWYLKTELKPN